MNKTGRIQSIVPDGSYPSQHGTIYIFQMAILTSDNQQYVGQIGSKTDVYPDAPGSEISVTITDGQYGRRFKKYDPQRVQQQGQPTQQQPQQGTQQPAQGPTPAPRPANSVNTSIERQCAFKSACTWGIGKTADEVMKLTKRGHDFIQTGTADGWEQFNQANPVEQDNIPFE